MKIGNVNPTFRELGVSLLSRRGALTHSESVGKHVSTTATAHRATSGCVTKRGQAYVTMLPTLFLSRTPFGTGK
jgi:hypothetical protein